MVHNAPIIAREARNPTTPRCMCIDRPPRRPSAAMRACALLLAGHRALLGALGIWATLKLPCLQERALIMATAAVVCLGQVIAVCTDWCE